MFRVSLLALLPFVLLGCGGESGEESEGPKSYRLAVIPKGTSHDFWLSVRYGAEKAAKELSTDDRTITIEWQGTTDETDKTGQKEIVETFIGQEIDGIVLAPIDRDTFGPVVKRAAEREIPVVLFDSGLSEKFMEHAVCYVATDNKKGGELAGEHLAKLVKAGDRGDGVIMLRYQAGSESTEARELGFSNAIAKPEYDLLMLNAENRINSDTEEALKVSESLLRANKDQVAGVFTVCEPNNKGMAQALENEGLQGEVVFVAFDAFPRCEEGLQDGTIHGIVLQDPVTMGYEAVMNMVNHLDGKEVKDYVDTGVYLATKENMGEEPYKSLLNPQTAAKEDE